MLVVDLYKQSNHLNLLVLSQTQMQMEHYAKLLEHHETLQMITLR
jgi:hypothetical protein